MLPNFMEGVLYRPNRGHLLHYMEKAGVELYNCANVTSFEPGKVHISRNVSRVRPTPTTPGSPCCLRTSPTPWPPSWVPKPGRWCWTRTWWCWPWAAVPTTRHTLKLWRPMPLRRFTTSATALPAAGFWRPTERPSVWRQRYRQKRWQKTSPAPYTVEPGMFFAGQRREKIGCGHGKLFLVTGAACRYNKHVVSSKR